MATTKDPTQLELFSREYIAVGREVSIIRTDTSGNYLDRHNYSGLRCLGCLTKIPRTREGGFMLVGTSNLDERVNSVTNTQISLIKTDANLNKLWMREFKTTYAAKGYDVYETRDGGYVIGAYERSFNTYFKMMIIKTDIKGNS